MSMQFQTRFCDIFGVENPIILAAMAGNINSASLVAAVSEAGGLDNHCWSICYTSSSTGENS